MGLFTPFSCSTKCEIFCFIFITRNLQSLVQAVPCKPTYYAVHPFNLHMCMLWCVCVCVCVCVCLLLIFSLTVGLHPILLTFSLYCWLSPFTVGLLPILLAFSLYCWPFPCTVGFLPLLLAFSLYCRLS